jgi:hypothetical protein
MLAHAPYEMRASAGRVWLLLFSVLYCAGQQISPQDAPSTFSPTLKRRSEFRSVARMVVLDVVVTDKKGQPVSNLSQNDFTVFEDDQQQTIAAFEPPGQHAAVQVEEDPKSADWPRYQAATPTSSALTVLVLDQLDTGFLDSAYARYEITKFLRLHGHG